MLKEALQFLETQAIHAAQPSVTRPDGEPGHVYFIDGKKHTAEPAPRCHSAGDLETIIMHAKSSAGAAAVWFSRKAVVVILDDSTRRDRVTLPLSFSPQLETIRSWGGQSKPFTQQELILMLRTMFKRSLTQCPKLIDVLRSIRFQAGAVTDSNVGKGKASISKSIESNVTGKDEIPDEAYFNVPIFGEPFSNMEGIIDVALEMDGGTQRFTLHPVPGTIDRQIALAECAIGQKLVESLGADRVFYGVP